MNIIFFVYFAALIILFVYGLHGFVILFMHLRLRSPATTDRINFCDLPVVTLQLPIYNEMYVCKRLLRSIAEINYPKELLQIQILDDSTDITSQILVREAKILEQLGFEINIIRRTNRKGFKAGALKNGLQYARGSFIAVFDADFIPESDFLLKTLPHFSDSDVGMVQTRWTHLNEDFSLLTRTQALALNGHFVLEQSVRSKWGLFFNFNGTAGIWRKQTIYDAGNWQSDTLTEDLDLSYRAQLNGWRFKFLKNVLSPAELPADIRSLKSQQFRWTKGTTETAKKILPQILSSHFSWKVKFEALYHLSGNIVYPMMLIVAVLNIPVSYFIAVSDSYGAIINIMPIFSLALVSSFMFYTTAHKETHKSLLSGIFIFPLLIAGTAGLSVNNTRAVLEGLFGIKSSFERTPKYNADSNSELKTNNYLPRNISYTVFLELGLALYYLIGIIISVYYGNFSAVPYQIVFLAGYGIVATLSLKNIRKGNNVQTNAFVAVDSYADCRIEKSNS